MSPGPPHPPSANARGCPHIQSQNQTRALPRLRGQAFWGLLRTLFLVSAHCVDRTWSSGSSWLCLCCSPASFSSTHCPCHCPLRAFLCSSLLSRASPPGWQVTSPHCSRTQSGVPVPAWIAIYLPLLLLGASHPKGCHLLQEAFLSPRDLSCFLERQVGNVLLLLIALFSNCPFMSPCETALGWPSQCSALLKNGSHTRAEIQFLARPPKACVLRAGPSAVWPCWPVQLLEGATLPPAPSSAGRCIPVSSDGNSTPFPRNPRYSGRGVTHPSSGGLPDPRLDHLATRSLSTPSHSL